MRKKSVVVRSSQAWRRSIHRSSIAWASGMSRIASTSPSLRPARRTLAPGCSAPTRASSTCTVIPPPRCVLCRPSTRATAHSRPPMVTVPTRVARRSSVIVLLFPKEFPGIALEIADHLLDVGVDVLALEQRADRALAGAQIGEQAVQVVDEAARARHERTGAVGRDQRALEARLGDEAGHAHAVVQEPGRPRRQR